MASVFGIGAGIGRVVARDLVGEALDQLVGLGRRVDFRRLTSGDAQAARRASRKSVRRRRRAAATGARASGRVWREWPWG
ncbi:MAG: hypothetical protein U5R31_00765 [Acidimicrobiia bacterium]|nr:hypothetical protein [Acidimicrobiia bacterium]